MNNLIDSNSSKQPCDEDNSKDHKDIQDDTGNKHEGTQLTNRESLTIRTGPLAMLINARDFLLCILRESLNLLCSLVPRPLLLRTAKCFLRLLSPFAARLLSHYLNGTGETVSVCTSSLVSKNQTCRKLLARSCLKDGVVSKLSGHVFLPQHLHSTLANRLSFGSLRLNWYLDDTDMVVHFLKWYEWSPNEQRISQAIHRAAYESELSGKAMPFRILGEPFRIPLKELLPLAAYECAKEIVPESKTLHLF